MKSSRLVFTHLYAIVAVALLSATVRADVVDDLLAGKPVNVPVAESRPVDSPAAESDRIVLSEEARAIADNDHPLQVKLPSTQVAEEASVRFLAGPPAPISLVPEPSAVGLASLALAYFFIFFRRRYA